MSLTEAVIHAYYSAFNSRRLTAAAEWIAADAVLEQRPGRREHGPRGYQQFAQWWLDAFPDARLQVGSIATVDDRGHDVALLATGTHTGLLDFGGRLFRPTNFEVTFHLRELLQVHDGLIVAATLSYDLQDIVRQLTTVDRDALKRHLDVLTRLRGELDASANPMKVRDVIERIGRELDSARHVVRPYYR